MDVATEFMGLETLSTFGGATTGVLVVVNGIRRATGWSRPWFALLVAQVLVLGISYPPEQFSFPYIILALINGFLLYFTALGANETASSFVADPILPQSVSGSEIKRVFFGSWLEKNN